MPLISFSTNIPLNLENNDAAGEHDSTAKMK
jgi:hypothetical protein